MPREPDEPTAQQLLSAMSPCEPYMAKDFVDEFEASRWTVQRRLNSLVESGDIQKKQHGETRVTYWIDPGSSPK